MPFVLPRHKVTHEFIESRYKVSCEEFVKRIPFYKYQMVISLLSRGPDFPVNIQWYMYNIMNAGDAYPVIEALECLGIIEPIGKPLDATKPYATTRIMLTMTPEEALEKIKAVIGHEAP